MDTIYLTLQYMGEAVEIQTEAEENMLGLLFPIFMNEEYSFTLYIDENDDWKIMRENNGTTPFVENELLQQLLKKLKIALRYAA